MLTVREDRALYLVRASLWITAPLNLLAGIAFALPGSTLGKLLQLPQPAHPLYSLLCGMLVALFGLVYFWLARQPVPNRPLLFVGACGKGLAAFIAIGLFSVAQLSGTTAAILSGDLLLAALWLYWLRMTRDNARRTG